MTVDLDSGDGLFDRLGKLKKLVNVVNTAVGDEATADAWPKELNDALVKYDGEANVLRSAVSSLTASLASARSGALAFTRAIRTAAQTTLIEMVDADDPLPTRNVEQALITLIAQMEDGSETIDASEPTIAITPHLTDGDGVMVASVKDGRGRALENILAEDIECLVTMTTTAGSERFTCSGEEAISEKLDPDWPAGSGASKTLTAISAAGTSPNVLANSDMEDFTTNTPDSWTIDVGSAGTDVLEEASTVYAGSAALELVGDGATLTTLSQTVTGLASRTPYAVNAWTRVSGVPAAGVLQLELWDGTAVIDDDAGTANSLAIDLTGETTTYAAHNAVFRLPEPVPATVKFRIRFTTALTNTYSVFLDHLAMAPMTEIVDGGPYAAAFSGADNFSLADSFTMAITNARAGSLQEACDIFFSTSTYDLLIPSTTGGTETIPDSLIG